MAMLTRDTKILDLKDGRGGFRIALFDTQKHIASDDQSGKVLRCRLGSFYVADCLAVTHYGYFIRDSEHLFELVRDDDDRLALLLHPAKDAKKFFDLLRR